jgi:hypothetical protein
VPDASVPEARDRSWLLLIHQIPPEPSYLRVKVGRRLQSLGAVPVKNSVYVLPRSEQALEDFQWVRKEVIAGGGDASVCEARFLEGLSETGVQALFNAVREADYKILARDVGRAHGAIRRRGKRPWAAREQAEPALERLRKRLGEIVAIDFFGARGRAAVERLLSAAEASSRPRTVVRGAKPKVAIDVQGRTWVTRSGIHVDRIASAWLIRRFIDPQARFKFVGGPEYAPSAEELRYDMFEAEFTHEGELCTFEVLRQRFGLRGSALQQIGEIVHDIDLKDKKFMRPEAEGLDRLIAGITLRHKEDEARLREGSEVFESLYEYFKRKR